jgi:polyhydroxyalkanoate synthesis regulator phasin
MTSSPIVPFVDFRAALATARREGERLATDVRTLVTRGPADLAADVRELRRELRLRADAAVRDFDARRTLVIGAVERELTRGVEAVWRGLSLPTRSEVAALARRVKQLEERVAAAERSGRGRSRRRRPIPDA